MFVCLSICRSHISKTTLPNFTTFFVHAQFFSGGVTICYVLPVDQLDDVQILLSDRDWQLHLVVAHGSYDFLFLLCDLQLAVRFRVKMCVSSK